MTTNWPDTITRWNMEKIEWRTLSAAELLWLYHVQTFQYLAEERKSQVRRYLTDTGDFDRLRSWDDSQMKETSRGTHSR